MTIKELVEELGGLYIPSFYETGELEYIDNASLSFRIEGVECTYTLGVLTMTKHVAKSDGDNNINQVFHRSIDLDAIAEMVHLSSLLTDFKDLF